ncbi:unnamed protein product [Calypogeia fissa]
MGRSTKGRKGAPSLDVIKASYRNARDNGDKEEEARWANQIGHAFKDRGEYVTALDWFRRDYEISSAGSRGLDLAKLMPTSQSIGEVYLRLQNYDDALTYQHKHFHWAEQAGDIIEQQRASTQLGRTYLELYETQDRLSALPDAKAYFQTGLDLARRLRTNPPANHTSPSGFVIEQVDAYNNLGLARALAEDFKQAFKLYTAGLKLCDEEEVDENDAARSRIHHNLGRLYAELRDWEKAKYHTELDIEICQKIPHAQGEAKGLMNLADLYFKSQDYEQATRCYKRALHIAQTLEDEDALISQIKSNIEIVGQARAQMKAFDAEMQKLSKLRREVESSKGTAAERKYIKQECVLLLELTSKAEELQAWEVHLGLAKRLKKLTKGLGDIEKLGDALEIVAASYYSLRNFQKSMKWHLKSYELCKRIGHLEGQIVSKINYGNALDASGDPVGALAAFQEAFEAAKTIGGVKMLPQQINALDNIHYCYFVRLEHLDDARKVELQLKELKYARDAPEAQDNDDDGDERCSETGSEGPAEDSPVGAVSICDSDQDSADRLAGKGPVSYLHSRKFHVVSDSEDSDDDNAPRSTIKPQARSTLLGERKSNTFLTKRSKRVPAARPVPVTLLQAQENNPIKRKQLSRLRTETPSPYRKKRVLSDDDESGGSLEVELGRRPASKSARGVPLVLEDDHDDDDDDDSAIHSGESSDTGSKRKLRSSTRNAAAKPVVLSSDDDMPTFSTKKGKLSNSCSRPSSYTGNLSSRVHEDLEDVPPGGDDWLTAPLSPLNSSKGNVSELESKHAEGHLGGMSPLRIWAPISSRGKSGEAVAAQAKTSGPKDEESCGLHATRVSSPSAGQGAELAHAICNSSPLKERGRARTHPNSLQGWTNTSLLQSYLNHCADAAEFIPLNSVLVEKLRYQKVAEEVVVSCCNMQDSDARALLAALGGSDAFSLLDMSHNLLGNATVHAIQELIKSTDQADLGLTLDLHCNKLGAGALLEICRCPVSLSRLEVLNLSGNRLTDAAARHLSKILKESQALATLNLESCALTTRAVTQLTSALHPQSPLNKLCIGNNSPIASHAIQELLNQLSTLTWFSYLDMKGIELDCTAVACLCTFLEKSKRITSLILQNTAIRNDGALSIADALSNPSHCLEKLDLSLNGFHEDPAAKLCARVMSLQSLSNLNLSGNGLGEKAAEVLAQGLARPDCRLKALDLSKCHLGQPSVLLIMQSLTGQTTLVDLNLAESIIVPLQLQLPPPEDLASTNPPVEISNGDGENQSARKSSKPTSVSTEEYCRLLERELAAADAHHSGAPFTSGEGEQQIQEIGGNNTEEASFVNCRDGDPEPNLGNDPNRTEELAPDLDHRVRLEVNVGPVQPEAAPGPERHTPKVELCVEGEQSSDPYLDSRKDGFPFVQSDPMEVDPSRHKTEPKTRAKSVAGSVAGATSANLAETTTATCSPFCEQLAESIRKAKGLQRLDLSNNGIDKKDVEVLFLAWSACPRGGSSEHEQHVDGNVLHFYVKGRPCPCADPPCCAAQ